MPNEHLRVVQWRACKRGESLQGFLTLEMEENGFVIRDCTYHRRDDGDRWIGLPAREYTKDGKRAWTRIVDFATKESYSRFQKAARDAIDRYFRAQSAESASVTRADVDWAALGGNGDD